MSKESAAILAGFRSHLTAVAHSPSHSLVIPPRMLHTSGVPPSIQFGLRRSIVLALLIAQSFVPVAAQTDWNSAARQAAHSTTEARILIVDVVSDRLLGGYNFAEAMRTLAAPGSTLKPLVLYQLLSTSRWSPEQRIACGRNLTIAGHRLACSHPPLAPFNAREALAWSCNSYFAQVGRSLEPGELGRLFRTSGLLGATGLGAKSASKEAVAEFREPTSPEAIQLALLGVEGIRITPLELAAAYRWLALQMAAHQDSSAARWIGEGLADSADFGIANAVRLGGVSIAGKTGTAEGRATTQTHGWFVGLSPAEHPRVVIVVYLPSGRGADAARVAADLLAHSYEVRK